MVIRPSVWASVGEENVMPMLATRRRRHTQGNRSRRMMTARVTVAAAVACCAALAGVPRDASGAADAKTVVFGWSGAHERMLVRPSSWLPGAIPTSGTSLKFTGLHWSHWGAADATAVGTASGCLNLDAGCWSGPVSLVVFGLRHSRPGRGAPSAYCGLRIPQPPAPDDGLDPNYEAEIGLGKAPCGSWSPWT